MLKVVQISTSLYGGAGIAAHRLHLALRNEPDVDSSFIQKLYTYPADEKNAIYTLYPQPTISYKIKSKLSLTPEIYYQKFLEKNPSDSETMSLSTTSYRLENTPIVRDANIVHLHWVANFLNYSTFFENIKQPIIWTLHDMNPFMGIYHYGRDQKESIGYLREKDQKELEKKIASIHQHENIHIVCPSDWLKELSEQSDAFGKYPHSVVPNGIDFSLFPFIGKEIAKNSLNINNEHRTILAIAYDINVYRKGGDLLAQAINNLKKSCNLITIGGEKPRINNCINHIHYPYIQNLDELNMIYTAADITVLPSREDNLPNVMLESFANGTPIISFSNGGMAEHVKKGERGILLDNISADSLLHGLNEFLDNKYSFDRNMIRDYAINNFSSTLQANRYIELYKKVLNEANK